MKAKTVFFCTECGSESPRWSGRCTVCGAWNSMVEQAAERPSKNSKMSRVKAPVKVSRITDMQADEEIRFSTGMGELDRVLGGGAVKGSLVLVGGAPRYRQIYPDAADMPAVGGSLLRCCMYPARSLPVS